MSPEHLGNVVVQIVFGDVKQDPGVLTASKPRCHFITTLATLFEYMHTHLCVCVCVYLCVMTCGFLCSVMTLYVTRVRWSLTQSMYWLN